MPFIHVQFAAAQGVAVDHAAIARTLTGLAAGVLHKKAELTAVRVEPVEPATWFIGNEPIGQARSTLQAQIQITRGTNTPDEKARFIAAVFDEIGALVGALHPTSYVVVEELDANAWGYGGRTQEARRDAATAAAR
jgi:4-oxalocrotonate tautomerase